jgi:hypothetical protein
VPEANSSPGANGWPAATGGALAPGRPLRINDLIMIDAEKGRDLT